MSAGNVVASPSRASYQLLPKVLPEFLRIRDERAPHNALLDRVLEGATTADFEAVADFVESVNCRPDRVARWWPTWSAAERVHREPIGWKVAKKGEGSDDSAYVPMSRQHVLTHLSHSTCPYSAVGLYTPARDGTVRWFGWDIDGGPEHKKLGDEGDIHKLRAALDKQRIAYLLETSKSAAGWHVWVFPREPVSAALARKFSAAILFAAGLNPDTEFFPKSSEPMPTGNQMGLFYSAHFIAKRGGTIAFDEKTMEVVPLRCLLAHIRGKTWPGKTDIEYATSVLESLRPPQMPARAANQPRQIPERAYAPGAETLDGTLDSVRRFLAALSWPVHRERQTGDGTQIAVACPNQAQHSSDNRDDSAIIVGRGVGYKCLHAHCEHIDWAEFCRIADPAGHFAWKTGRKSNYGRGDLSYLKVSPPAEPEPPGEPITSQEQLDRVLAAQPKQPPGPIPWHQWMDDAYFRAHDEPEWSRKEPIDANWLPRANDAERDFIMQVRRRKNLWKVHARLEQLEDQALMDRDAGQKPNEQLERELRLTRFRIDEIEEGLGRVAACGTIAKRGSCASHGARSMTFNACERDCVCPSCGEARARTIESKLADTWAHHGTVCLVRSRYGSIPADIIDVQEHRSRLVNRFEGTKVPMRWIAGLSEALAIGTADLRGELRHEVGIEVSIVTAEEGIRAFIRAYREPAIAFHMLLMRATEAGASAALRLELAAKVANFPFAPSAHVPRTRGNRSGEKEFPWPSNDEIRQHAVAMARARRGEHPCPEGLCDSVIGAIEDAATGEKRPKYCGLPLKYEIIDARSKHVFRVVGVKEDPRAIKKEMDNLAAQVRDSVGFGARYLEPTPKTAFIDRDGREVPFDVAPQSRLRLRREKPFPDIEEPVPAQPGYAPAPQLSAPLVI